MDKNITVLYKTLMGNPAMRWAQENEYPRFEREAPILSNEFQTVFFEPDENWQPEDASSVSRLLEQQFQTPPHLLLEKALFNRNQEKPQQQAYINNLVFLPNDDKAQRILTGGKSLTEKLQENVWWLPDKPYLGIPKEFNLPKQEVALPKKTQEQSKAPQTQGNQREIKTLYQGMNITPKITEPHRPYWRIEDNIGAIPSQRSTHQPQLLNESYPLGQEPLQEKKELYQEEATNNRSFLQEGSRENLPMQRQDTSDSNSFLGESQRENKERVYMYPWLMPTENLIEKIKPKQYQKEEREIQEEIESNSWNRELDEQEIPVYGNRGVDGIYDESASNLSPQMHQKLDESIRLLSAYPKFDHILSLIEKTGPIKFEIDENVEMPCYVPSKKCIKVPSAEFLSAPNAIAEEIIHRFQHIVYGDDFMNDKLSNLRAIEAEAKMLQDFFIGQYGMAGTYKINEDEKYHKELKKLEEKEPFETNDFYHYWGDKMSIDKTQGLKNKIDKNFSWDILNYYYGKKK